MLVHLNTDVTAARAESCELAPGVSRMEVLPGIGWDNLRNKDMALVFEYDYSSCQLTNDGKLLLPDGCFTTPLKQSESEIISQLFEHWNQHSSMTSTSINVQGHSIFSKISGKFSYEHTTTKTNMYNDQSIVVLVQIRQKVYIVHLQPGTKLHPIFKQRLLDIASQMTNNNTDIAHYMSELLIRDYGTHYITSVQAGGILAQEDYVTKNYLSNSEETRTTIKASASAHFFSLIHFSAGYTHTTDDKTVSAYLTSRTSSYIKTYGGPPYRSNFTVDYWEDELNDNLVAIDREGVPLHFAVIPEALSELPPTLTLELAQYVEQAINSYYKHNTHYGCTNPNAGNFYFGANIDDGSCQAKANNFTFGGVYQTYNPGYSECSFLSQKNPKTSDYSCPVGYEPVILHSGSVNVQHRKCKHFFIFTHCYEEYITCNYQINWCVATGEVSDNSGYLFGGLFSSITPNPLTQAKSCPNHFYPIKFGLDTEVCVSDDYELGYALSVSFAGFHSCSIGNPLASTNGLVNSGDPITWPRRCPTGYSQHLAVIEQSCEINYCTKTGSFDEKGLPPVKLPPFRKYPKPNTNYTVGSFTSANGNVWIKNETTLEWYRVRESHDDDSWEAYLTAIGLNPESYIIDSNITTVTGSSTAHHKSNGTTAALIVVSTALIGLVIVIAMYGMCKYKKHKNSRNGYGNLDSKATADHDMEQNTDV